MSKKKSQPTARRAADTLEASAPLGEIAARLALAAPVVPAPSPMVKNQLLARIRASKAPALVPAPAVKRGWRFESANADEGWRGSGFPGVRFKTLSVDEPRDSVMVLVEMAAGAHFPDHVHDQGGDEGIVISGDVINAGQLMRAGDYYRAEEGTAHTGTVSPSGCVALVNLTARAWKQWQLAAAGP